MKKLVFAVWIAGLTLLPAVITFGYENDCGNEDSPGNECPPDQQTEPEPTTCPTKAPGNNAKDGSGTCDAVGADSIKPLTANKQRFVTDLETFGAAGMTFTRIYNSRTTDFNTNYWDFGFRQTWQHNWNYEVRDLQSTTFGVKDIKVRYSNGNELNFTAADTNGSIHVPPAFHGDRIYKWVGTNVGQTLVVPSGWEYDFKRTTAPRYQLVRVRNGQGSTWTLSYSTNGQLQRIQNDFGRWIELDRGITNGTDCITGVRSSDGREVTYKYGTWEYALTSTVTVETTTNVWTDPPGEWVVVTNYDTVIVTNQITNTVLKEVNYPDGSRAQYVYVGADSISNGRPLVAYAIDPMVPGPGFRSHYKYNYNAIFDFGSGAYRVTGTMRMESNLPRDLGEVVSEGGNIIYDENMYGAIRVDLPGGSGSYPEIRQGDGSELTRKYNNGLLTEVGDGEGRPTFYARDNGGMGYIIAVKDADDNTTTFTRDFAGRMLSKADPLGHTNFYGFNEAGFLTNKVDALGRVKSYIRDTNNLITRAEYPDGSYEEWTHNQYGQALTHRQRNGGVEMFAYYGTNETGGLFGDLKTSTDAMSNTVSFTWDSAGLMAGITDARGNTTSYSYNWRGKLLLQTNADPTAVTLLYDEYGNVTNVINELGHRTEYSYDDNNRVATIRDPLGRLTTNEYGRIPSSGSGCGSCGGEASTITRITTPDGKITEYAYDHSDKRTNETIAAGTSDAATTTWTYDTVGRLKSQTDANGNVHTWGYDAASRVIAETNAAGDVTTYGYDAAGNLTNRTDGAGMTTFWAYDAMNRVTAMGSGELRYEYLYDEGGRRTAMHTRVSGNITETTTYSYDLNNHLRTKTDPTGYVLSYGYDSAGNRTNLFINSVTSAPSVVQIAYAYDTRNRLAEIVGNDRVTHFGYDALGRRTNAVWPNETTATYAYDAANQLLSLVHGRANPPGEPLASFTYSYDFGGNRTNMITLEGTNSYGYDNRDWLTYAAYPNGNSQEFAYDPLGNRTNLGGSGSAATSYTYGPANRLLSSTSPVETNDYFYDDAGRLTNQIVNGLQRRYEYSFRGQMTALHDMDGRVFSYDFDGDGNRISQSLNDCLTSRFVYDGPDVVLDLNASNELVCVYVNGPGIDEPIETIAYISDTPRIRHVYHTDALGSVVAMTDNSGAMVKTYAYEAFGNIRAETGDLLLNRVTYGAREALGDSLGFYYYRYRVLDPNTGRFSSPDPLSFVDGPNLFTFVNDNPINSVDPLGLFCEPECKECNQKALDKLKKCLLKGLGVAGATTGIGALIGSPFPVFGPIGGAVIGFTTGATGAGLRCYQLFKLDATVCLDGPCKK